MQNTTLLILASAIWSSNLFASGRGPELKATTASLEVASDMPSGLQEAVEKSRYRIREQEAGSGYHALSPGQGMQAGFTPEGLNLTPARRKAEDWRWGISLRGYGYGDREQALEPAKLAA